MKRFILGSLMLLAVFMLAACGDDNKVAGFQITTASPPSATVGTAYSQTLAASGGTVPYTWTLATGSTLPAGLTLSTAGIISGTPITAAPAANFTVTVTDSATPTAKIATKVFSITVTAPLALTVTTASPLPAGTVNAVYAPVQLLASGGTGTLNWTGTLPAGLALSATGIISGTPTIAATTTFTVTVKDSATPQNVATKQFSLTVSTTVALDGAALYASNCASCHGPLATSAKRGRTALAIQNAINANTGNMGFLSTLIPAQVQAIATALFP